MECLECQRLIQQIESADRVRASYPGPRDGEAYAKLESSYADAVAAYEKHRTAAHPESIDERLEQLAG